MKKIFVFVLLMAAVRLFAACGGGPANAVVSKTPETPVAAPPTKEMLVGLETKAFEAWKNRDAAFWDGYFDQSFVAYVDGKRYDKAGEIGLVTGDKCEVASFALSEETMVPLGNDAAILTTKVTVDAACGGKKVPSPGISTSLYIRSGDTWKSAYHNEIAVTDPKTARPSPVNPKPSQVKKPKTAETNNPAIRGGKTAPTMTDTLLAIEKKGWEAWKARDSATLGSTMTAGVALVDQFGTVTGGKPVVLTKLTEPKCEITSAVPIDATGTQTSLDVAILTYRGTITGTCDGHPLSDFWGTTIYQRVGGEWKAAYIFQTPG